MALLDSYAAQMHAIQGILDLSVVREKVNALYVALYAQDAIDAGIVALLLAICASMGFWDRHVGSSDKSSTSTGIASAFISKQALYAAEYTRLSAQVSLEAVQAGILLTFHFCHLEGFTSRTRLLHSSALTMARDLGLHRIDVPSRTKMHATQSESIEKEVGRRVWWHLAGTDW